VRRLRHGSSPWLDRGTPPLRGTTALRGNHEADVVIVGGGITGCATALELARSGLGVILLEARRIGRGSTAASTALLMQEPDTDFRELALKYGQANARDVWRMSRHAVRSLIATLSTLPNAPRVDVRPSLYFTRHGEQVRDLRDELAARHRAGIAGRWLTPPQLTRLAGIDAAAAILTTGNAQVDPYESCLAFARAARGAGASLHERSRVRRVRSQADGVRIETERAAVTARWTVIATGYATPEFKPLAGRFRMSDTYVVATPPLDRAARSAIGLGDVMLWDTERPYHYARWTRDRRLLFGGHDQPHKRTTTANQIRRRTSELLAELCELYPAAQQLSADYAWEGLFATTPDGLPYIGTHRRYPHHLFALGYGGNGMTFGFLAAQIIARAVRGKSRSGDELFRFNRAAQR
jgi:glycine/D-amino acid oxidase-like deaminating enzyme